MRLRKQKVVAKENEFYIELLQKALPQETVTPSITSTAITSVTNTLSSSLLTNNTVNQTVSAIVSTNGDATVLSNGHLNSNHNVVNNNNINNNHNTKRLSITDKNLSPDSNKNNIIINNNNNNNNNNSPKLNTEYDAKKLLHNGIEKLEIQYMEHPSKEINMRKITNVNDFDKDIDNECNNHKTTFKNLPISLTNKSSSQTSNTSSNNTNSKWNQQPSNHVNSNCLINSINASNNASSNNKKTKNMLPNNLNTQKDDHVLKLEADIKRLKADLQASRQTEMELRGQLTSSSSNERGLRAEVSQLQQDNENLQTKLHNLVTARQQDKQNITQLEKRLLEEKKSKSTLEAQLLAEKKAKKAEEAAASRAVAIATAARAECTDNCKTKRREMENDLKQLKRELKIREEHLKQIDREAQSLRQYKDSHGDTEILMSALSAMQDKTTHLENSLSAETRLKLDLFSALGDTKRQLAITQTLLAQKDKEIDELKSKIADIMSVLPQSSPTSTYSLENNLVSSLLYNTRFLKDQNLNQIDHNGKSVLDPNASVYTPKCDL